MQLGGVSPWGRSCLGEDGMRRLRLHLTRTSLQLVGPAPWVIRLNGAPGQVETWERTGVSTANVWPTIVAGLAELGVPLPPDEEWERLKADVEAIA